MYPVMNFITKVNHGWNFTRSLLLLELVFFLPLWPTEIQFLSSLIDPDAPPSISIFMAKNVSSMLDTKAESWSSLNCENADRRRLKGSRLSMFAACRWLTQLNLPALYINIFDRADVALISYLGWNGAKIICAKTILSVYASVQNSKIFEGGKYLDRLICQKWKLSNQNNLEW